MKASHLLGLVALALRAHGHGGVFNYSIGGVGYSGNFPYIRASEQNVIARRWWPDPIENVADPNLSCNRPTGNDTEPRVSMPLHAPVNAGSNVSANWNMTVACRSDIGTNGTVVIGGKAVDPCTWYRTWWVHGLGPILVYLAACNGSCSDVDTSTLEWFKIQEMSFYVDKKVSQSAGYPYKEWYQADLLNNWWNVTIPENLKPGNYMMRHEAIMLELDVPQFYPQCSQLTISGNGNAEPGADYLVKFPGAYSLDDPGIAISGTLYSQDWYYNITSPDNYTIPGPKVWTGEE